MDPLINEAISQVIQTSNLVFKIWQPSQHNLNGCSIHSRAVTIDVDQFRPTFMPVLSEVQTIPLSLMFAPNQVIAFKSCPHTSSSFKPLNRALMGEEFEYAPGLRFHLKFAKLYVGYIGSKWSVT